jgi:hypothetical protein
MCNEIIRGPEPSILCLACNEVPAYCKCHGTVVLSTGSLPVAVCEHGDAGYCFKCAEKGYKMHGTDREIDRINNAIANEDWTKTNIKPNPPKVDMVNHPPHYTHTAPEYEPIKVIEAWRLGFNLGNVVKYIARAGKKNNELLQDLKKARWYLDREIGNIESKHYNDQRRDSK